MEINMYTRKMILGIFILFINEMCVVNGKLDVCPSYNNNVTKCNADTTITDLPSVTLSYASVEAFYSGIYDSTKLCSSKTEFKTVAKCVVNSYRQCQDNDFKTLVATSDAFGRAVDYFCSNTGPVHHYRKCIGDSVADCIRNREAREKVTVSAEPDISSEFSSFTDYYCRRRQIYDECINIDEDVKACAGAGTDVVFEELRRILKPAGCGASSLVYASSLIIFSIVYNFI